MADHIPSEAPPSYTDATATASNQRPATLQVPQSSTHRARNGIPPEYRRSMEDEGRSLPPGWIRQYDDQNHHQFFVDTNHTPPRSIWQHPYDDEEYMSSLDPQERQRIQALHKSPSHADIEAESSADDEDYGTHHGAPPNANTSAARKAPPWITTLECEDSTDDGLVIDGHSSATADGAAKPSFGRKMKDKLTVSVQLQLYIYLNGSLTANVFLGIHTRTTRSSTPRTGNRRTTSLRAPPQAKRSHG